MPLTITLTPDHRDAQGHHGRAIQDAIQTISQQRGGTVHLTAGTYVLRGPLRLGSHVRLEGEGSETILTAPPFVYSPLTESADIGQKEIHLRNPEGFLPGSGLIVVDKRNGSSMAKVPFTVQHVQDGVAYIGDFNTVDWSADQGGQAINYFPFIVVLDAHDVEIAHLRINQKRENDATARELGIWGAGIYARQSENIHIDHVVVENAYGDGLRCGSCLGVKWTSCVIRHCTHYGVHPGSHTRRVLVENCDIHDNGSDGIYVCWGVQNSVFRGNHVHHNGYRIHRTGFCIGHKDTDNLIEDNHIHDNAKHGIHIRIKSAARGAHRNTFRRNRIEDNGRPWSDVPALYKEQVPHHTLEGAGIFINGVTHDLVFEDNIITNRNGLQKRGIHVGPDVLNPVFRRNQISGHEVDFESTDPSITQE